MSMNVHVQLVKIDDGTERTKKTDWKKEGHIPLNHRGFQNSIDSTNTDGNECNPFHFGITSNSPGCGHLRSPFDAKSMTS